MNKNKGIIPKNTRYVPRTQQPYCCVPTCIQMVMLKHNIPLKPVELMAHYMKVVVSPEKKKLFWNLPSVKKRPKAGYGTRLNEDLTADPMFKKLGIPLKMGFRLIDTFDKKEDLKGYLYDRVKADIDTIICFDYGTLFNTGTPNGHVCVLDQINKTKNEVRFIDPVSTVPKWRTVKLSKLYKAMKNHGKDNMGGCWEISKV